MKKIIFTTIVVASLTSAALAQQSENQNSYKAPLANEEKLQKCMGGQGCQLEEALALLSEMNTRAAQSLENIHDYCQEMEYADCIVPQRDVIHQLQDIYDQSADLLKRVDAGATMSPALANGLNAK